MCFTGSTTDWYFASVPAMVCVLTCYIRLRYNGTQHTNGIWTLSSLNMQASASQQAGNLLTGKVTLVSPEFFSDFRWFSIIYVKMTSFETTNELYQNLAALLVLKSVFRISLIRDVGLTGEGQRSDSHGPFWFWGLSYIPQKNKCKVLC